MLYLEYEKLLQQHKITFNALIEVINEKEELFARTQPKSFDFSQDHVSGGGARTPFDDYLIAKEKRQIDQRIEEAKSILQERESLLKRKEAELRDSKNIYDRIYVLKFLDHFRVYKIASKINYSEAQTYRYVMEIEKMIGNVTK